jgi:hypothetical protein
MNETKPCPDCAEKDRQIGEFKKRLEPSEDFERLVRDYGNACASTTEAFEQGIDIEASDAGERAALSALRDHEAALRKERDEAEAAIGYLKSLIDSIVLRDQRRLGESNPYVGQQRALGM